MPVSFKYKNYLNQFKNCPPNTAVELDGVAFRYIFEDKNHANNFLPVLLISPKRINSSKFDSDQMKCSGYGLSMYNTLKNASFSHKKMSKKFPNFYKIVGNFIAELDISSKNGLQTTIDKKGHFDFHEFVECNLVECINSKHSIK